MHWLPRVMSDGLVTPTVLPVMEMVGYDRDFAQVGNGESVAAPVAAPPPATGAPFGSTLPDAR
jgi:hypothetical protein